MASKMGKTRTYQQALSLLASLQSNAMIRTVLAADPGLNSQSLPETIVWLRRTGHTLADLGRLRCIHVAGTKGKGSVCTYAASILQEYFRVDYARRAGVRRVSIRAATGRGGSPSSPPLPPPSPPPPPILRRIGLYTSPHLVSVRERIAIDGEPISRDLFTRYFFEVWDAMVASLRAENVAAKPSYFRFLTIMAFHTFLREGVRDAVIECGIGGEHDPTNVLPPEAVSVAVITRIGLDHADLLGSTRPEVAWHKAGILKPNVPAVTVALPKVRYDVPLYQRMVALAGEVIRRRSVEKGVKILIGVGLKSTAELERYLTETASEIDDAHINEKKDINTDNNNNNNNTGSDANNIDVDANNTNADASNTDADTNANVAASSRPGKMNGSLQAENRALAAVAAMVHLDLPFPPFSPFKIGIRPAVAVGLRQARLRGRCELIHHRGVDWVLDGAHTSPAVNHAAQTLWELVPDLADRNRVLIFNQQGRDPAELLKYVAAGVQGVTPAKAGDTGDTNDTDVDVNVNTTTTTTTTTIPDDSSPTTTPKSAPAKKPTLHGPAFHHAIFTTNDPMPAARDEKGNRLEHRPLANQHVMSGHMNALDSRTTTAVFDNIEQTLARIDYVVHMATKQSGARTVVLVTGSFHLVGAVLKALEPEIED